MAVFVDHNAGFFSCCSVKLKHIVDYINTNKKLPRVVDSSQQFEWYKIDKKTDITFDYFEHYNNLENIEINKNTNIFYNELNQVIDYSRLDFTNVIPLVKKYFSPSNAINNIVNNLQQKYNLDYDNICVLFYRGNDKNRETKICSYNDYIVYANRILNKNPDIKFLVQSDETEFINLMNKSFPNKCFIFNDEIRHMNKCDNTVDVVMKDKNYIFSKYYLGITIVMSKCKYIIFGSGNCSIWIIFYRGNNKNVYQNLDNNWIPHSIELNESWIELCKEEESIHGIDIGRCIRYGSKSKGWVERITNTSHLSATHEYFNIDPAQGIKKTIQMLCINDNNKLIYKSWVKIGKEGETICDAVLGKYIRYGADWTSWVVRLNNIQCFTANNEYFGIDPSQCTKKIVQMLCIDNNIIEDWIEIGQENETIHGVEIGKYLRYGVEGVGWVVRFNNSNSFQATSEYFGIDPVHCIKKVVQMLRTGNESKLISRGIGMTENWVEIGKENETIRDVDIGKYIRYGSNEYGWVIRLNNEESFTVTSEYFGLDPAPCVKKSVQMLKDLWISGSSLNSKI